jgi:hypothetical protein
MILMNQHEMNRKNDIKEQMCFSEPAAVTKSEHGGNYCGDSGVVVSM